MALTKSITGALMVPQKYFLRSSSDSLSPYVIRRIDATNLGVLPPTEHDTSPNSYISVMKTTNPLMFHDDFCAENDVPVLVGLGPITDRRYRDESSRLCRQHGWTTKPARWMRLRDVADVGLLPDLLATAGGTPIDPSQLSGAAILHLAQSLPTLKLGETAAWTGLLVHTELISRSSTISRSGVSPATFREKLWPAIQVRLPPAIQVADCAWSPVAGYVSTTFTLPRSSSGTWINRRWLDLTIPPRASLQTTNPQPFDCGWYCVESELSHVLTPAQLHHLRTYRIVLFDGIESSYSLRREALNAALRYPDVVTPNWAYGPLPTTNHINPHVPPIVVIHPESGKQVTWYNIVGHSGRSTFEQE